MTSVSNFDMRLWKLQVENAYLRNENSLYLSNITLKNIKDYKKDIEEAYYADVNPEYEKLYQLDNPSYIMITITFDPDLFGEFNDPEQEKHYILYHLWECIQSGWFYSFVGCFEYQKNGSIHAHVVAHMTENPMEMYKYLKSKFTANPRNRWAIDLGRRKLLNGWLCYINGCNYPEEERTTHIFKYGLHGQEWLWYMDRKFTYSSEASVDVDEGGTVPPQVDLSNNSIMSESNEVTQTVSRSNQKKINMIKYYYKQIKDIEKTLPKKYHFTMAK